MSVSQNDLDSFHNFASRQIATGGSAASWSELLEKWQTQRERAETIASIRRGVDDADAGRLRDLADIDREIRTELGFPADVQ